MFFSYNLGVPVLFVTKYVVYVKRSQLFGTGDTGTGSVSEPDSDLFGSVDPIHQTNKVIPIPERAEIF